MVQPQECRCRWSAIFLASSVVLPQDADEHCPERPTLPAVNQGFDGIDEHRAVRVAHGKGTVLARCLLREPPGAVA